MKTLVLFLIGLLLTFKALAQSGCPDPEANNYDPAAVTNDGSCTYDATDYSLSDPRELPGSLNENSGLIYTDGQLWTLNDSGSAEAIYKISEADGSILQTVTIANATNVDWEAITADANYIYIGDFGNNSNGNRTDLKIYRVSKAALGAGAVITVSADIINFAYPDQVIQDPAPTKSNNTQFDCEAFLVKDNLLHLFTKDWVNFGTVHYTLPATPGSYTATRIEEFAVDGLITDAHISATNADEIVLIGYASNLSDLFMWVLWDYSPNKFFSGNKRRIGLGNAIDNGQIEGVTFTADGHGYISSEQISQYGFTIVPPRLYSFSTATWVPLPVELLTFKASYSNPVVKLSWQTATEKHNAYFTIERSADGGNFIEIGRQNGAGNSSTLLNYYFTDRAPIAGMNYYRLKQTDLNGDFTYSRIITATATRHQPRLKIYPVPAQAGQPLQLEYYNSNPSITKISISGTDGKVRFEKEAAGAVYIKESLPTEMLPAGLYILKVTDNQHAHTTKILIE